MDQLTTRNLLKLLKNDVEAFNQYRENNPGQSIDFYRAGLWDAKLQDANLRGAILRDANLQGAYLWRASLRYADLRDASLRDAKLRDADLRGANLAEADLRRAYLEGAKLTGACLRGTILRGASLWDADLRGADLTDTYLREADLREANLRGANLTGADLRGACISRTKLKGAKLPYNAPAVQDIHQKLADAVNKDNLNMKFWHCKTTHCRAGWVVALAGEAGRELEEKIGTNAAAALIYMASDPALEQIPDWVASNEDALADIQEMAEASR